MILPLIEHELRLQCTTLCDIMLPVLLLSTNRPCQAASNLSSLSRIADLPALVLEAQAQLRLHQREIAELQSRNRERLMHDLQRCNEMTTHLSRILIDHKLTDRPRAVRAKTQYVAAVARAMQLRAKVLTKQLLVDTYPADRIALLKRIQYVVSTCTVSTVVYSLFAHVVLPWSNARLLRWLSERR